MTTPQHTQTTRTVPLGKLWLEAPGLFVNPRQFTGMSAKELDELGESIKAEGIVDPPKVRKIIVKGEVYSLVIDGQRRIKAALDVLPKSTEIPVLDLSEEAVELTPEIVDELYDKALVTLRHVGLSSYELSSVAESMHARGRSFEVIAEKIDRSKTWISRMLAARKAATPQLMTKWRKGDVTDEQFKELAEVVDPEVQNKKAAEVIEARKSGDRGEARVISKETKETSRAVKREATEAKKATNGVHKPTPRAVVTGEQRELFASERDADAQLAVEAEKKKAVKPPSKIALDELLAMAHKRPPTSDYVKGLMDGVRFSQGIIELDELSKAWVQYVSRIEGRPMKAKRAAKPKKLSAKAKAIDAALRGPKPGKARKAKKGKR